MSLKARCSGEGFAADAPSVWDGLGRSLNACRLLDALDYCPPWRERSLLAVLA